MQITQEQVMEDDLIKQLTEGISQWTYRPDLKNEEGLWANFKNILEYNNVAALDGKSLTDQEFQQVKNQLSFSTFYDAAVFFRGENGKSQVRVQREDATLGTVHLDVINTREIAGGTTTYEVINQFESPKASIDGRDRRFDVTLLINGLPMIHIELKSRREGYRKAFHQINKYLSEGKFMGIYSTLQMFVVSNGTDTRYIAASSNLKEKEKFLTRWVNHQNEPVNNYLDFAEEVLSIPAAHEMVAHYSVLDHEDKAIILLRPYQIHAINAVKAATKRQEPGYIWHTTGSGKTLTSYQVARNLMSIPTLDKTIFVVDRRDLDFQTTNSFRSYSENDLIDIDDTDHVHDLIKKLVSRDRSVIVTTIQKLQRIMDRYGEKGDKHYEKLHQLRVAFVVDECHRAVTPQTQERLMKLFPKSLWYGFTGTPIFAENARDAFGDLPRTTQEQYGEVLHTYTVKEAIHDESVLGFQVEHRSTFKEDALNDSLAEAYPNKDVYNLNPIEKEELIPSDLYETDEHRLEVIDSIINESQAKLGLHRGPGRSYGAILTVSSIAEAQKYYDLFKEVKAGNTEKEILKAVQSKIHDFPKVAITYSLSENEEGSVSNQEKMQESLNDYNKMFDTSFTLDQINAYNTNLANRLARKRTLFLTRKEQIDIVIVVDRMLTGFDAPSLAVLFMDRAPMRPHHLIQAFSRTNRLYVKDKQFGQIMTFRTPNIFKQEVEQAFVLYSNGGENEVMAPTWAEAQQEFKEAIDDLYKIAPTPEAVDELEKSTEKQKFARAFQRFDKAHATIQVYSDFEEEAFKEEYHLEDEVLEDYKGKYENVIEELRKESSDDDEITFDIEYELQSVSQATIDYSYLMNLIQTYVPNDFDEEPDPEADNEEVEKALETLEKVQPEKAQVARETWEDLLENREKYRNQQITVVIQQKLDRQVAAEIQEYSAEYGVAKSDLQYVVNHYDPDKEDRQLGEQELIENADYEYFKEKSEESVNRLKYRRLIREGYKELIEQKILPYLVE
jgi:type I restriction enzyme R subunit